ncbi:MAG: 3-dehydro-scyllo-inosose hydrolase [Calditrichaeota bacterium]|nr:3-dehydro-scyllo-inosose hydrolase [Calditrichota bacterium]TDI87580.1 MAG: creatininase family protein [Caldithrix sp.]
MIEESKWLESNRPDIRFEDTPVGRQKKQIWEASDEEIDKILGDYGIPSPSELGKIGVYMQNTVRQRVIENRRKNDIVFIPLGTTENHGLHTITHLDNFMTSQILEGVRRHTAKQGRPINLVYSPLNYGAHPHHHIGMPGTVFLDEDTVRKTLMSVMLGLWNDGFRKIIMLNNHGQQWVLESAIQEFQKTYNLPGIFWTIDWHRAAREFFRTKGRGGPYDTDFVHADEAETAVIRLLMGEESCDMECAEETAPEGYLPDGHFDKAVDPYQRPMSWSEGQGHFPIELSSMPEGVFGKPKLGEPAKAKRCIAAILKYLTLINDQILEAFPPGQVPPAEDVTLRSKEEMEPYLREPLSPGWKSVYALPKLTGATH